MPSEATRRRPLGRGPPHRGRPGRRPGPVGDPPQARAVYRRRMPGRRPPPGPADIYRDTFRRLGLLGGQGDGEGQEGQGGDEQEPTGKTGERFKVACGCQPPRSFWVRAKQFTPGPITCGVCGQDFNPRTPVPGHQQQGGQPPRHAAEIMRRRGSGPGPGRPGRRFARAPAPPEAGATCLAGAGPPPPAHRP